SPALSRNSPIVVEICARRSAKSSFIGSVRFAVFYFRLDVSLWLLFVEVALDGVEDAVDELCGFVGREAASDFERLVDGYGARRRFVEKLVHCQAQNIAIDDGHARNAPVFRTRANAIVEQFRVL